MTPKIIAMYLPQFHTIKENDKFWGKGFTDWVTVKAAKPLFNGHMQPRRPLNNNYYDLSDKASVEWQCDLAHKYGIFGFGVYHYWFNDDKNLLTKPAELMRDSTTIKTKYFLTWDNCSWVRSWSNVKGNDWSPTMDNKFEKKGPKILIEYILGKEENWKNHYEYVKTHFFSKNYLKIDNKPVFSIINYNDNIQKMSEYWNELAKNDGFDGVYFIYKFSPALQYPKTIKLYNYEPHCSAWFNLSFLRRIANHLLKKLKLEKEMYLYDYDDVWKSLLNNAKKHKEYEFFHGAFVGYDDSPRRGRNRSRIILGASPEKFKKYLSKLLKISVQQNKEYIFLTAWNEWGEGAFLEPDQVNEYEYLNAIKEVVSERAFNNN